jgi:hypothetical protein
MAGTDFSFQYYLKYGPQKIFNLEVTDTSGMEHTVKIPSIKLSEWEQRYSGDIYYYDDVSVAYDLNFNDANGYAIMRISTFEFNQEKQQQAFEHFCNNSFELLRAKPNITNLIIDLRQNPGGDLYNAFYLFSFLARDHFCNTPQFIQRSLNYLSAICWMKNFRVTKKLKSARALPRNSHSGLSRATGNMPIVLTVSGCPMRMHIKEKYFS